MVKLIIYGASESGQKLFKDFSTPPNSAQYTVLCFCDGNPALWGKAISDIPVISPKQVSEYEYDRIVIASLTGKLEISYDLLHKYAVPPHKIDTSHIDYFFKAREVFCLHQSEIIYSKKLRGNVAEAGVAHGDFAKYINAYFPDRRLYLFDTFTGHDARDFEIERSLNTTATFSIEDSKRYATSVDAVKACLPYPLQADFRVGYFPETTAGIEDEFVFVSVDMNLYAPTKAALQYFYPRMVKGGVIVCHDYFSWDVEPGAHIAIDEFCAESGVGCIAIGDRMSVAIIKQ